MDKCKYEHQKVYSNHALLTYPPQYPWICRKCGEIGNEKDKMNYINDYDKLVKKFKGVKNGL